MAKKEQTKGKCTYCEAEFSKSGMVKHLSTCPKRQEAIEKAEEGKGTPETLYHLRVKDKYQSDFWLDLEMPGSKTMKHLDSYLREIWLECCGHLSQFSVGGWGGKNISFSRKISQVFTPGIEITHIYDFGTESVTLITLAGTRVGKPTNSHPVALMARNVMPKAECIECGQPASWLCIECVIEENEWGVLCDEHAKKHEHEDYGEPIELVNSPRLGMCGYTGPAEPPY